MEMEMELEIEKLANDIDDVTDPSSFDKVISYLEELQNEAEEYMELLVKKLEFLEITWKQPWYQGSSAITKPYQPFYERNETEIQKFRTDKFTKEEHDRISRNWIKFTKKYNLPDKLRIFMSWKNSNHRRANASPEEKCRRFVAAYLARGLERTIHQVFRYISFSYLRELETRVYSKSEEKIMEVCFMHKFKEAPAILAVVLGRHSRGIYKRRMAHNTEKPERKKLKWNIEEAGKLLRLMLEHSELPLGELKNRKFYKSFWLKLQEEMNRDYTHLHLFWYCNLHVQLFVEGDVKLYKLRRKLFKLLRDSRYRVWSDIRWAEVETHFPDGFTSRFLYKMCISVVRKEPNYLKTPLHDIANFALQTINSAKYTNKRLKKLTLSDEGKLEVAQ